MRSFFSILLTTSLLIFSMNTYAEDAKKPASAAPGISAENYDNMKENVKSFGFTFMQTGEQLNIEMNQAKVLSSVPMLVKEDIITKVEDEDVKRAPLAVSVYAVGVTTSVTILTGVYAKDKNLDKLHVTVFIMPTDGSDKKPCFSYDFTRSLYEKLDMNSSTNDFINKTPGFAFSDYCKSILEKEDEAMAKSN